MHDAFTDYLLSKKCSNTSASELRSVGRKASDAYVSTGVPLNESVAGLSKKAGLNEEQTKRVVETANKITFRAMLRKGVDGGNISFPLANYEEVRGIMGLNKSKTAGVKVVMELPPPWRPGDKALTLDEIFGFESGKSKVASKEEMSPADFRNEWRDACDEVDNLLGEYEKLSAMFEERTREVRTLMLDAMAEDVRPYDVLDLVKHAGVDQNLMDVLLTGIDEEFTILLPHVEKTASIGRRPCVEHPLYVASTDYTGLSKSLLDTREDLLVYMSEDKPWSDSVREKINRSVSI